VAVVERAPGEPMALVPSGGLVLSGGWVRRAELPPLLGNARAVARWGSESLWATSMGLYTTQGATWLRLDRAGTALTDVDAMAAGPTVGDTRAARERRPLPPALHRGRERDARGRVV
jgi:hypothetical protein